MKKMMSLLVMLIMTVTIFSVSAAAESIQNPDATIEEKVEFLKSVNGGNYSASTEPMTMAELNDMLISVYKLDEQYVKAIGDGNAEDTASFDSAFFDFGGGGDPEMPFMRINLAYVVTKLYALSIIPIDNPGSWEHFEQTGYKDVDESPMGYPGNKAALYFCRKLGVDIPQISDTELGGGELVTKAEFAAACYSAIGKNPLTDAAEWARKGISEAYAKGFVPEELLGDYTNAITRAEFCRMTVEWLAYAAGKSIDEILDDKGVAREINAFSDTQDANILAAYALGITSGTVAPMPDAPGTFDPNSQFSRQQAATMLRNVCRAYGADVSDCPNAGWTDSNSVASWALEGINFCYKNGLMGGTSTSELVFNPTGAFTREMSIFTFNNINIVTLPKAS